MTAIDCRAVSISIDGTRVVSDVDLSVETGEWVSIIGPNGAGKSTLLRAVVGAIDFDGLIRIDGTGSDRRGRARAIAWVAQNPVVPPGMRVVDYALLGRTPHLSPLGRESAEDLDIVADALDRLDLNNLADRFVTSLSGGERQRVLLARALAQQAPILLLDEPTTALDLGHQQEVLDLLEELRRSNGITIVSTMHDLGLAGQYADRLVLLANGSIVEQGTPGTVLTSELIETHYGARVSVITDPDGTIFVVPRRSQQ